jgi:hypothetical protein
MLCHDHTQKEINTESLRLGLTLLVMFTYNKSTMKEESFCLEQMIAAGA